MSNQAGLQLYQQSMNGLLTIDNADSITVFELDAEIINTDDLTVNNLLTVPNISNTTIGTITQTGTNIITQTGTGKNILKNTDISGNLYVSNNVDISGNLTLSGSLTYDILDIDCENLIVQNDAYIVGNLQVNNVLQIFDGTGSIVGVSQPNNTKHQLLPGTSFTVKAGYNIDFTITIVCPIAFQHEGVNNGGVNDSLTKLNSRTTSIKKNGVFLQNADTSSQNNAIPTPSHRFTFGSNGNFNYNKYFTTLTNTFTINHIGSSTDTLYEVFYTFSWTTTQISVTNTSIGFYLNTTTTFFAETGVTTGTTPALGTFDYANNWTAPSFNVVYNSYSPLFTPNTNLFENVYQITCDQINTNNLIANDSSTNNLYVDNAYVNELLDVDNVSVFNPNLQLQEFISDETIITTSLFVGTPTTIYSFEVFGNKKPITFDITYSCPLAISENNTTAAFISGASSTINSATLTLFRNGVLISTTTGTEYSGSFPSYDIGAGAFNYKQFCNIIYGTITGITDTSSVDTPSLYQLKMAINNTRLRTSGGTYGYEANTLTTGITKSANVTNNNTFPFYSAGAYTISRDNQTPIYSTDTGTLTNATLINNTFYNKAEFYNLNFVSSATFTLQTTNSYYLISRNGNTQINLPFLNNKYRGFTVWLRKAVPSINSNHITLNASVNGVTYYENNMTAITTSKQYNTEVAFNLIYAGDGNWYSLNHH